MGLLFIKLIFELHNFIFQPRVETIIKYQTILGGQMKSKIYILLFGILFSSHLFADWGFYYPDRSWIGIDFNGVNTSYRLFDGGTVSGPGFFHGSNLGSFTSPSQTLAISFWDIKTWKNGGSDVQQAQLYYRIFEQGYPSGSFTQVVGGWLQDYGGGNQKWGKSTSTSIDITSLLPGKTWVLEVYIQVYGTSPDEWKYDSNGGANFQATFTTDGAFPVELLNFKASAVQNQVILTWQTATETNNYGFDVERKEVSQTPDLNSWLKIGFVGGAGNSNSTKHYSFTDKGLNNGKFIYRLKQIDSDGSFVYSKEIEIEINSTPIEFSLNQNYPNPFNPSTSISFSIPTKGFVQLKVYDILGNEIATLVNEVKDAGMYTINFSTNGKITSGVYLYRLEFGSYSETRKMVLAQ